jgi:hypothetical protein
MPSDALKALQDIGEEFHTMLGVCVGAWASVDSELFRIFRQCIGPADQAAIIYYRSPGIDVRFKMTDEIVRSLLPKRQRKSGGHDHASVGAWRTAYQNYDKLLGVRRRLAHQPVRVRFDPNLPRNMLLDKAPRTWLEIYPSEHERTREQAAELQPLDLNDLKNHLVAVSQLAGRLHEFYSDVLTKHVAAPVRPDLQQSQD